MRSANLVACLSIVCLAVATLTACSGSQLGTYEGIPGGRINDESAGHSRPRPLTRATSESLLYLASNYSSKIYVYTYPQGQLTDTLTGLSGTLYGECVDPSGDVFVTAVITSGASTIYEYAHGGTSPIATLSDPGRGFGCSVDPKTGDLAVSGGGSIAIYNHATGTPTIYRSSNFEFFFCGYDNHSNLYISAISLASGNLTLVRLADGSSAFEEIKLNTKIYDDFLMYPSMQWDGRHMTVSSVRDYRDPVTVYRLRISGRTATVVGSSHLRVKGNSHGGQSWIQGNTIVGIETRVNARGKNAGYSTASLWNYPQGGEPYQDITHIGNERDGQIYGVTVSPASMH